MRTWWLDRRRLAGPEVELQGVVGLICAVYAWREWVTFHRLMDAVITAALLR
jgi:hypothetical protein